MIKQQVDIALIGGGIMSATLGALLHELMPDASIVCFERLTAVAEESSEAWNNAGTGHAAFCELNYTPQSADGSIEDKKAIKIAEQFEMSKQFWAYLVSQDKIKNPSSFIRNVPHYSFVFNKEDKAFLRKRFAQLISNPLFENMIYSDDKELLSQWFPLIMQERKNTDDIAATKMDIGCDVDFGKLTELLFDYLKNENSCDLFVGHEVKDIDRNDNNTWELEVENVLNGITKKVDAKFVFVGAGGGSLKLLNKADIKEVDGFGGFPVGGKWLRCTNPEIIEKHFAKVYGKASIGAPPMSVPHLDTRIIDGKRELLFGPYAGFSTKFLKHGSPWDLASSIDLDNLMPMIQVGINNIPLTEYLIEQVRMSFDDKLEALKLYYPEAKKEDWELLEAGQRVQVIKKNDEQKGVLEFGTELIHTADGSLAGLLGASPGASTAVSIMLSLCENCFADKFKHEDCQKKLKDIFPSWGKKLNDDKELLTLVRQQSKQILSV